MEKRKYGITEFLLKHAETQPVSFHMPGHKGSAIYKKYGCDEFIKRFMDCDITEIDGADNLFKAEGIIRETFDKYRRLYDVSDSYLLVNGTSAGIIASILSSVERRGKLIMARNCHKSVFNAVSIGDIYPVYAYPQMVKGYDISGAVSAGEIRRCIEENPDAAAVILPSPNYYGICSDIKSIAEVVHESGKLLIVDQAHGAHLKMFERFSGREDSRRENEKIKFPESAETAGADIVINSIHKTLASFTQSAVLNVNSDRVDTALLEDKLQAIESSSPSYILMSSLDINADIIELHGRKLFKEWEDNLEYFYREAKKIKGLRIMNTSDGMDMTKINLDMSSLGIDGALLNELLMERGVYSELATGNILMCMTGIGNRRDDFVKLLRSLKDISRERKNNSAKSIDDSEENDCSKEAAFWIKKRKLHKTSFKKHSVKLDDSAGRICAASITPYPPGIPLICPGEMIEEDDIEYIKNLINRGETVIGINENGEILSYLTVDSESDDV